MNYIYSPTYQKNTMWKAHNSLVSYFGRFNYNLLDRYLLTATFRADGSSRFKKARSGVTSLLQPLLGRLTTNLS